MSSVGVGIVVLRCSYVVVVVVVVVFTLRNPFLFTYLCHARSVAPPLAYSRLSSNQSIFFFLYAKIKKIKIKSNIIFDSPHTPLLGILIKTAVIIYMRT